MKPINEKQVAEAENFLLEGRFREARDLFKVLSKQDFERFQPFLVEANIGLYRSMLENNQRNEAEQVLNYLVRVATPLQLEGLKSKSSSNTEAAPKAKSLSGTVSQILCSWKKLAEGEALSEEESLRLADSMQMGEYAFIPENELQNRWSAEQDVVRRGFVCLERREFTEVSETIRALPARSPFMHWRTFLKALSAFHQGDFTAAVKWFEGIPEGTIVYKPSRALLDWARGQLWKDLDRAGRERRSLAVAHFMETPKLGKGFVEFAELIRKERLAKAMRCLNDLGVDFFSIKPSLESVIGSYLGWALRRIRSEEEVIMARKLCQEMLTTKLRRSSPSALLYMARLNLLWIHWSPYEGIKEPQKAYSLVGSQASIIFGESLPRKALMEMAQGDFFIEHEDDDGDPLYTFFFGRRSENPRMKSLAKGYAVEAYQRAMEADENNLEIPPKLLRLYGELNMISERNRLLDSLVLRFPQEKAFLLPAGRLCIERKAFQKGVRYLQLCRQSDCLDPEVLESLMDGLWELYRSQVTKRREETKAIQETWKQLMDLATGDWHDFLRARWAYEVRRELLLQSLKATRSKSILVDESTLPQEWKTAPGFPPFWNLVRFYYFHQAFLLRPQIQFNSDLLERGHFANPIPPAPACFQEWELMWRLLVFSEKGVSRWKSDVPYLGLIVYWNKMPKQGLPFERIPSWIEGFKKLVLRGQDCLGRLATIMVEEGLKSDPENPFFRFFLFKRMAMRRYFSPNNKKLGKEMIAIYQEAKRRGDQSTVSKVSDFQREYLHKIPLEKVQEEETSSGKPKQEAAPDNQGNQDGNESKPAEKPEEEEEEPLKPRNPKPKSMKVIQAEIREIEKVTELISIFDSPEWQSAWRIWFGELLREVGDPVKLKLPAEQVYSGPVPIPTEVLKPIFEFCLLRIGLQSNIVQHFLVKYALDFEVTQFLNSLSKELIAKPPITLEF